MHIQPYQFPQPTPTPAQQPVLGLICVPLPVVRIGIVGLGTRGMVAVQRLTKIQGAEIVALCDIRPEKIAEAETFIQKKHNKNVREYSAPDDWKKMCESSDVDLIYICTDWLTHTSIAVYGMECGKHVAVEVPAAFNVAECWQLVDTAERTQRHCMMLENCCYDEFELNTLYMIQNGVLGEAIHAEGGYIHDLRSLNFPYKENTKKGMNRRLFSQKHTGNLYPTHGLGPVCQALGIHRGDRMKYLVSMSSRQQGITEYARKVYGNESDEATRTYTLGDMNTTLIYTEMGKTIMLQHDVNNPRPYSRIHSITAMKGYFEKYPQPKIALESNGGQFLSRAKQKELQKQYEHPFITQYGKKAKRVSGDHFFDYIMDCRLIHCLQKGLPLDMDVYDAAEWSCITELSEFSVKNGSIPVAIPDFTRGRWK